MKFQIESLILFILLLPKLQQQAFFLDKVSRSLNHLSFHPMLFIVLMQIVQFGHLFHEPAPSPYLNLSQSYAIILSLTYIIDQIDYQYHSKNYFLILKQHRVYHSIMNSSQIFIKYLLTDFQQHQVMLTQNFIK